MLLLRFKYSATDRATNPVAFQPQARDSHRPVFEPDRQTQFAGFIVFCLKPFECKIKAAAEGAGKERGGADRLFFISGWRCTFADESVNAIADKPHSSSLEFLAQNAFELGSDHMENTYHVFRGVLDVLAHVVGEAINVCINTNGFLTARVTWRKLLNVDIAERRCVSRKFERANWILYEIGFPVFDNVVFRDIEVSFLDAFVNLSNR